MLAATDDGDLVDKFVGERPADAAPVADVAGIEDLGSFGLIACPREKRVVDGVGEIGPETTSK